MFDDLSWQSLAFRIAGGSARGSTGETSLPGWVPEKAAELQQAGGTIYAGGDDPH